jgi:uncharacterized protein YciI
MHCFYYRLHAPRPSFAQDMDEREKAVMATHAAFWRDLVRRDIALLFGPVLAPQGVFGIAILRAESLAAAQSLVAADPALQSGLGFDHDIHAMAATVAGAFAADAPR